ncbi:response regulator transcription factor [Vibrio lentus]|uniref:Two-component system response regulator n=1 Tax=Vibrio lentus TaxID=136468 RepID=A0A2N7IJ73_9VIBR|nr:response regulator transcription factor [Vibrio lentus]PML57795.1 two-component system response regulator [Vibrio lentus]PMM20515.1 two-component system response regulator [Vibrio lentus]
MLVLLVEDDKVLASALSDYLELDNIECDFAYNGITGLSLATENKYDIIILDVMLPKLSGFSICQSLRDKGVETPILMMTAKDSLDDKLEGFQVGTDDYVTKPFAMAELSARLKALANRSTGRVSKVIHIGDLSVDMASHTAHRGSIELSLSPLSWKLLKSLVKHSPNVVAKETLEREVWGEETSDNNLKVQIHKLRQAIDKPFSSSLVHSVPKVGFALRES